MRRIVSQHTKASLKTSFASARSLTNTSRHSFSSTVAVADSTQHLPLCKFSETESMMKQSVQDFCKQHLPWEKVAKMDAESKLDPNILKAAFDDGLMGIEIPEQYGGSGMTFFDAIIAIEELAKVDPSISVIVDVQNTLVIRTIMEYGNEKQKQHWLPRLAKDTVGCFCLSEPSSGSDAFALKARAELKGDQYVLNGTKYWITNSQDAGLFIVMANVDPSKGYKGITAFLVDKNNPGIRVGKKEDKLGIRASATCEVILEDCVVNKEDVLGEVGKGYKIAIETLNEGRIGIAAQMLGLAQGAFDYALPYMKQRHQFGQPISSFQGMQFQYAHAATEIEAARLLVYEAARRKLAGLPFTKEAAMAKYYASEVAGKVSTRTVEWLGGVGFTKEFAAEKFYRDAIIGKIYEGTSNINLQTIAKIVEKEYN